VLGEGCHSGRLSDPAVVRIRFISSPWEKERPEDWHDPRSVVSGSSCRILLQLQRHGRRFANGLRLAVLGYGSRLPRKNVGPSALVLHFRGIRISFDDLFDAEADWVSSRLQSAGRLEFQ
jgi:hypothetical protein